MTEYKLDLSFNSREGTVNLHVFDVGGSEPGPVETCEVSEDSDTEELRQAWGQFYDGFETPDMGQSRI